MSDRDRTTPDLSSAHRGAMATMSRAQDRHVVLAGRADQWLAAHRMPLAHPPVVPMDGHLVLVVDDEKQVTELIRRLLMKEIVGIEVAEAHSIGEVRDLLAHRTPIPSVVLLDLHLGLETGWDLVEEMPEGVRVILMSGVLDRDHFERIAAKLNVRWIEKGLELTGLVDLVREELAKAIHPKGTPVQ